MKLRHGCWMAALCLSLLPVESASAGGPQPPGAARHIPREAVYALLVSNPGQALDHLDAILQNFKSISPQIDLKTQGERLKQEIGENILTVEGLTAFGLDPAGTYVLFGTGIEKAPVIALSLGKPGVFKEKLIALIKKNSPKFNEKPRRKAGVEIYEIDKGYIGFKGSWCVVLSPESILGKKKDKQLLDFFKPGKTLASDAAFRRTIQNLPDEWHALLYLDLKRLVSLALKESQDSLQSLIQMRRKAKEKSDFIKNLKKELARLKKLRKKARKELAFIDRLALSWTISKRSIDSSGYLGVTPAGFKTLAGIFPAQKAAPGFHAGLIETSVLGAWMSVDLQKLLDKFGWIPTYGDMTIKKVLEEDLKGFKKDTQVDFFKEVLGGLAGPGSFYLLQPGPAPADDKGSPGQQWTRMIRVALVAQVEKPARAASVIKRLNRFFGSRGMPLETQKDSGASIATVQPEPGTVLSWGIKGDSVFFSFGENTAQALVKILPQKAWSRKSRTGPVGDGLLDFAVLGEGISSAMSRGVGGEDAAQFRMMIWPIMQQVLGKLSKIHFSARLVSRGLSTAGSLEFR